MELLAWIRHADVARLLERAADEAGRMEASGLRAVMPEVHDPSLRLDRAADALHKRGIRLHPWIRPTLGVKDPVCRALSDPEAQQSRFGTKLARACLSNRATIEASLVEIRRFAVANRGAIDGLHLDYVRNDNALFLMSFPCQCQACQSERLPWLGRGVLTPDDMKNPCVAYKELRRRNDAITRFVRDVGAIAQGQGLALSLAARANYLSVDDDIWEPPVYGLGPAVFEGQDWAQWAAEGLLDFICTMNYHTDLARFERVAREHARLLSHGRAVFYSGLGVKSSMGEVDPAKLRRLLEVLKGMGIRGGSAFHWGAVTGEHAAVMREFA